MLMTIVFWVLILALAAAIALLFLPILVRVHLVAGPQVSFHCDASALSGLAPPITLVSSTGKRDASRKAPKSTSNRARRITKTRLAAATPGLIADLFRHVCPVMLQVECEFGLNDPADTGHLAGVLLPLANARPAPRALNISLSPNFERPCLEGEITAAIRLTLAALILPFARFAWRVLGPDR